MKILLTTLNSKFIHSSLALRYLKSYNEERFKDIHIEEYTVNNNLDYILREIYLKDYDIVCFSCYIWNIRQTLEIAKNLRKVNKKVKILLGGPEVSYSPMDILEEHGYIDYIISGEGEETIGELFDFIINKRGNINNIKGLAFRQDARIQMNEERNTFMDLDEIPFPYGDLSELDNKIIYYESSRGCPFNCQYCLSSTFKGVRYLSIDRVKSDLKKFLQSDVKQVKFVDRTFNADKNHSLDIMKYIESIDNGKINFHFEITATLIDDEILSYLKGVRKGLFQFEVGIQSTSEKTLKEIGRNMDFEKIKYVINEISSYGNIHLHLDLIAGLPYEDYKTFLLSFDDVYRLKPNKIQLGFLKLLKGSGVRVKEDKYGYIYRDIPPYEVMCNDYITYREMIRLKLIEEMIDEYCNSHNFDYSIDFITANYFERPSSFFEALALYWEKSELHHVSHKKDRLYEILLEFYRYNNFDKEDLFKELLKFDYLRVKRRSIPEIFDCITLEDFKNRCHKFLQDEDNIEGYLPKQRDISAKKIINKVHFEIFKYDILYLIVNPIKEIPQKQVTILFDYDVDNKDFEKSRYFKVHI